MLDPSLIHLVHFPYVTRFLVVPLTLVALFSGCYKWSAPGTPVLGGEGDVPSRVRVTLTNFTQLELEDVTLVGDTLRGWANAVQDTVLVPVSTVARLEVRKTNWVTTGLLIGLGVWLAAIAIECADADCFEGMGPSFDN
jgi:hypothetical protein